MLPSSAQPGVIPGAGPAPGPLEYRTTQDLIASGALSRREIRTAGLKIFATPFNQYDGYVEGAVDFANRDRTSPGNRPMLGDNGTMLRVNGLDTQSCLECHNQLSATTVPVTFGMGGAGGINAAALFQPTPQLAESFHRADDTRNAEFITAKLLGGGRHDPLPARRPRLNPFRGHQPARGEAQTARDSFLALRADSQAALITFLKTLRNPRSPNRDVPPEDR